MIKLVKLLVKEEGEDSPPQVVGVYSDLALANRAKNLCPGSFLLNIPLNYIPNSCQEGKELKAWGVNIEDHCSYPAEQIDVFSAKGGFQPSEEKWINPVSDSVDMRIEMWAKSKEEAEELALSRYQELTRLK